MAAPDNDADIARSLSHQLGHTAGLRHPFADPLADENDVKNEQALLPIGNVLRILNNLMNSPANPVKALNPEKMGREKGTELTPEHTQKIESTVQQQQPKKD